MEAIHVLLERCIQDKGKDEGRCFPEQGDFEYSGDPQVRAWRPFRERPGQR